ncbi:MAG: cell division protein ZapA [Candidatus Puniceispirillales bacterium]
MNQSSVTVSINGKEYPMACSPGQENHVLALGQRIDQVVRSVAAASGPIGESRLLVMAALILTDRLVEAEKQGGGSPGDTAASDEDLAALINSLAERIEKLA